ncbi:ANTAR domain-containing protein [Tessaracoccus sp. G1721]
MTIHLSGAGRASAATPMFAAGTRPAEQQPDPARRPSLALVEPDSERAAFLGDALSEGYDVRTVAAVDEAADMLRSDPPELVLADLASPSSGEEFMRALRAESALADTPVVLLEDYGDGAAAFDLAGLRIRLGAALARARHHSLDAAWRRALLSALHDGVLIFDAAGTVMEMNPAFERLFGYTMSDGPFSPPYPWWPTQVENADQLAAIAQRHADARAGATGVGEALYYDCERRPVWVSVADAKVRDPDTGLTATIRTFRDITRQMEAQTRRAAAALVSADFAGEDDIATLLGLAVHGFELLFGGTCTIEIDHDGPVLFHGGTTVTSDELPPEVLAGLGGRPSADSISLRPGILLVPQASLAECRAWVQFPRRRQIGPDEMIVADLLAQAFALAVDRLLHAQRSADRQEHMARAIESHRLIGQAVGILVERHRLTPGDAFERLKSASQQRNVKLRAVAELVIETGADPETL